MSFVKKLFNTTLNKNVFIAGQRFIQSNSSGYHYDESSSNEYWYPLIQCHDDQREYYLCEGKKFETSKVISNDYLRNNYDLNEENKILILLKSYIDFNNSQFEDAKYKIFELRGITNSALKDSLIFKIDSGDLMIIPFDFFEDMSDEMLNILYVMFNMNSNLIMYLKTLYAHHKNKLSNYSHVDDSLIKI